MKPDYTDYLEWKVLLVKYVAHVEATEGPSFLSSDFAPCGMLNLAFSDEEKAMLDEVFSLVRKWNDALSQRTSLELGCLGASTDALRKELAAAQAKIDELMLEYCPEEMTTEQRAEWAKHQRPVDVPKE